MTKTIDTFLGKYRFLSNFYPAPITYNGINYPSIEHFYQALKSTDTGVRRAIAACDSPAKAKQAGRKASIREHWEVIKVGVMFTGLAYKFSDPKLKSLLLDTGDAKLTEGNSWHDNIWGDCFCDGCDSIDGANMLGKLLMGLRAEFKEQY